MGKLEIVALGPGWVEALSDLFEEIRKSEDASLFHPHPFTPDQAARICSYEGEDLYYALAFDGRILGYGLLRGWDDGFSIPSLGIFVRKEARSQGAGKLLMLHLHAAARLRGAKRIRLKVYRDNRIPIRLYENLGYAFENTEGEQLVGYCDL